MNSSGQKGRQPEGRQPEETASDQFGTPAPPTSGAREFIKDHQVLVACAATILIQFVAYLLGFWGDFDKLEDRVRDVEHRMEFVEKSLGRVEDSVTTLNGKVDQILFELARRGMEINASATEDEQTSNITGAD